MSTGHALWRKVPTLSNAPSACYPDRPILILHKLEQVCTHRQKARKSSVLRASRTDSTQSAEEEGPVIKAAVAAATTLLSIFKPGEQLTETQARKEQRSTSAAGVAELLEFIRNDFEQHAYFVTGDIHTAIYADKCYFADPTVSFSGLQTWKRNLQLLVPFLVEPRIELSSLQQASDSPVRLKAVWRLLTGLKLPWRPFIDVKGSTVYLLDTDSMRIVQHIEEWEISGLEAIQQMFRRGPPQK